MAKKNSAETSTKNLFVYFNLNLKIKIIDKLGFLKFIKKKTEIIKS